MTFKLHLLAAMLGLLGLLGSVLSQESSPLGYPIVVSNVYIEGAEVEPIPRKDQSSSIVIRVLNSQPSNDGFLYVFSLYGLDPGQYNLIDFLQRKGSKQRVTGVAPIPIDITHKYPLTSIPKPEELKHISPGKLGGYRALMTGLVVLWAIGLGVLIFYRNRKVEEATDDQPKPTLHEKLYQLVIAAAVGDLNEAEQAKLERLVIGHWKKEIPELNSLPPAKALIELRSHPEASPLILKMEKWLHSPDQDLGQQDIEHLLKPFIKANEKPAQLQNAD